MGTESSDDPPVKKAMVTKESAASGSVTVNEVKTEEEMRVYIGIRYEVFVNGTKILPEEELDEYDVSPGNSPSRVIHMLARVDGVPAGTGRLILDYDLSKGRAKIGRIATLEEFRGKGVATAVLRALEEAAKDRGFEGVKLGAIHYAVNFYKRIGYLIVPGKELPFDDCGIPHYWMERTFS